MASTKRVAARFLRRVAMASLMDSIVPTSQFMDAYNHIEATDEQSAKLLAEVGSELRKAFQITSDQEEAYSRFAGVLENYKKWRPDLIRNNVFKAAHALHIPLPSSMFASDSGLAARVSKLAQDKPELRKHLVPLLRKYAYQGRFFMPRSSYLPAEVRDKPPMTPEGTDLAIWTWEENRAGLPVYSAIAFVAKANKPLWYYNYRNEAQRDKKVSDTIEIRKQDIARKQKIMQERKEFAHDYKEGDILYSSWGYDQTNVDFYQVTKVIGKAIEIRPIASKTVAGGGGPSESVVAVPDHFTGTPMRKIPRVGGYVTLTSYSSASKWDGYPKHETGAGWGH